MEIVKLVQGSPEWHAHRANHFNASDAPAMMGVSPYVSRNELIKRMATGIAQEVDAGTQRVFDNGHRFEALARPIAEGLIEDDLYPVVGVDGRLSASFDGITMDENTIFEHKTLNERIRTSDSVEALPEMYRVQMEQQLAVSGAEKCLFMATQWDENDVLLDQVTFWYYPDYELRQRIVDGWNRLEADVANYTPEVSAPVVVGSAPESLPALRVEVTGMVTSSNLAEFRAKALNVIGAIKTDLQTDEDFADAAKTVKWCKEVEDKLEAAKQHALSQTASIEELFRVMDEVKAKAAETRVNLDKRVKSRKEEIKTAKVVAAKSAFSAYVSELQTEIVGVTLSIQQPDFAGAIKGKSSLESIQNALDTLLDQSKGQADSVARDLRAKLAWKAESAKGYEHLFPDLQQLVSKPVDDFKLVITSRINEEIAAAKAKEEALRESIRQQELARIAAENEAAQVKQEEAATEPIKQILSPEIKRAVVVEHHDEIAAFLKSRSFTDESRVRAVLVEFVKFQAEFSQQRKAA